MKAYIYNAETKKVVATIESESQKEIQEKAQFVFDWDTHGLTYTPAFGSNEGLIDTALQDNADIDGIVWAK